MDKRNDSPGALAGLRVIDLTQMLAGPICTQVLADQGAQVIKVESLAGDGIRSSGPFRPDDALRAFGGYFQSVNRNKSSIALDLKQPQGRELLIRLVKEADVVVENFRAGVMERLGLGYEQLRESNPRLVYATIRGFGDPRSGESPYADWPAYDVVAQAMGGIMSITGTAGGDPTKIGPGIGDIVPGLMLGIGILAAVHHAQRTGRGQFVDVSMVDSVLALCERIVYQQSYEERTPGPEGNRHPLLCPFGLFPARDGWVSVACPDEKLWAKLARIIGRPEMAEDPRYATNPARVQHAADVIAAVEDFTRRHSKAELAQQLGGVTPFGPVYTARDIFADPHFARREMLVEVEHPGCSTPVRIAGVPIKLSETPGGVRRRAPLLGEHTDDVLQGLGLEPEEIARLRAQRVVA
ncbi:CaiB/BaiF CoA-transferase family protein [Variovorax sp. YR216]|uniref:CaiB/BaiF CoA transferase family protein n=1 Tax=Variovorax sp. YR216 TaxID=1882828 RepID=UPI00089B0FB3|nr:CoA transferase [Variovorax sp. YR216]SEB24745.1 Crotonobetainyl-CoA:carnitine CoA-transferase CaiB [Variovorax sp. YR216]